MNQLEVKVRAFRYLAKLIGSENMVDLRENATIEDLMLRIAEESGTTRGEHSTPYEFAEQDPSILINGRNIKAIKGQALLRNGDVLVILPPFIGG